MIENYQNRMIDKYIVGEKAIAYELGVSVITVKRMRQRGLPTSKLGGQVVIKRSKLENWIEN